MKLLCIVFLLTACTNQNTEFYTEFYDPYYIGKTVNERGE